MCSVVFVVWGLGVGVPDGHSRTIAYLSCGWKWKAPQGPRGNKSLIAACSHVSFKCPPQIYNTATLLWFIYSVFEMRITCTALWELLYSARPFFHWTFVILMFFFSLPDLYFQHCVPLCVFFFKYWCQCITERISDFLTYSVFALSFSFVLYIIRLTSYGKILYSFIPEKSFASFDRCMEHILLV